MKYTYFLSSWWRCPSAPCCRWKRIHKKREGTLASLRFGTAPHLPQRLGTGPSGYSSLQCQQNLHSVCTSITYRSLSHLAQVLRFSLLTHRVSSRNLLSLSEKSRNSRRVKRRWLHRGAYTCNWEGCAITFYHQCHWRTLCFPSCNPNKELEAVSQ